MNFIINNQEELSKKLALNVKVSSTNKLIDSFKNLKMIIKENTLEITSFNGENCIISTFNIERKDDFVEEIEFLVEADIFKNIIDTFTEFNSPCINVFVDYEKERMYLNYNNIKFNLKILKETKDFNGVPKLDTYTDYKTAIFNKNALRRAILNTQKCAGKDQARPILEAVNIIVKGDSADIVTLDGYKAAYNKIECESAEEFTVSLSSSNAMPIVLDVLKSGYDFVEINTNGVYSMIENDDTVIFLKQISGNIPNYTRLIQKKDSAYYITLDKKTLDSALSATRIGNAGNSPIKLIINTKESSLTIESIGSTLSGDAIDNFEITLPVNLNNNDNEDLEIVINRMFMTDLLKSVYTDKCLLIIQSAVEPLFIENENNDKATYLMLPINQNKKR